MAAEAAAEEEEGELCQEVDEENQNEWWVDTTNHTGTYSAEYAKTGRAKCRTCGELIGLRELRIGLECDEKGWGVIIRWQHVACTRLPKTVAAEDVDGYDALTVPDQQRVVEMLEATGPPELVPLTLLPKPSASELHASKPHTFEAHVPRRSASWAQRVPGRSPWAQRLSLPCLSACHRSGPLHSGPAALW